MNEVTYKHIDCRLENGLGVVRFRYSQHRSLQEYEEIEKELNAFADSDGVCAMVLNLDAFEYVPSRFLGTMVGLAKKLGATERRFAICRMQLAAESAFLASRLDLIIAHYVSEEEACAAMEVECGPVRRSLPSGGS